MEWIEELLTDYNLTVPQLSAITGIPARTLYGWKYGYRAPADYMERLLRVFVHLYVNGGKP